MRFANLVILQLLIVTILHAQPEFVFSEKNKTALQQESVSIHLDKNNYYPGESVWLKAYIYAGLQPSSKSSGIKLQLINAQGQVVIQKIFPVVAGTSNGNFQLPKELPIGNYLLRAYTKWMMQFGEAYFYQKPIIIGVPTNIVENNSKPNFTFYPEGGHLVNGIMNVMAFACKANNGKPLNCEGFIVSSEGDTVANFTSTYQGLGKVAFIPQPKMIYKAFVQVEGNNIEVALPKVQDKGTVFLLTPNSKGKSFTLKAVDEAPAYIIGHIDDSLVYKAILPKGKSISMGLIPTANMPSGILTLAVFNEANELLAERQTFVHQADAMVNANIMVDTLDLNYRAKNTISLQIADTIDGIFSVSVVDADKERQTEGSNIAADLLLINKLHFFTSVPSNILNGTVKEIEERADLVLLTSNTKQPSWKKLLQEPEAKKIIDDGFISIEGLVTTNGRKPLPESELTLIVQTKDSSTNYLSAKADNVGKFSVKGLLFEDSAIVYYQGNGKKFKEKFVEIANTGKSLSQQYATSYNASNWLAMQPLMPMPKQPQINDLGLDTSGNTIAGVTVNAKKKSAAVILDERYARGAFTSSARQVIDLINNPPSSYGNVFQYLQGRYSYLTISGTPPNYTVQYRGSMSLSGGPMYMALFLDEFPTDAIQIATVPLQNIAMIKIFSAGIVGGPGGALAIYTKKPEDGGGSLGNMNKLKLEGYSHTEVFQPIEYAGNKESFIKKDNRTTLYWNPNLIINQDQRKVPICFYNSDNCKRVKIVVQGFTNDGRLLYAEKVLQ
jgi:hypothetical protein